MSQAASSPGESKAPSRVRAVFFGFLGGVAVSSAVGLFKLNDRINAAADQVLVSVRSLGDDVGQLASATEKIEALEREIQNLKKDAVRRDEVRGLLEQVTKEKADMDVALSTHKREVMLAQEQMFAAIEQRL